MICTVKLLKVLRPIFNKELKFCLFIYLLFHFSLLINSIFAGKSLLRLLFPESEITAIKNTITATNALSQGITLPENMTVTRTEQSMALSISLVTR